MSVDTDGEKVRGNLIPSVFEALPMPAILIDAQGLIVDVNQCFLNYFGRVCARPLRKEERLGRQFIALGESEMERARLQDLLEVLLVKGEACSLTCQFAKKLGASEIRGTPLRNPLSQLIGGLMLWEDATSAVRRQRQQQALGRVRQAVAGMRRTADLQDVLAAIRDGLEELAARFDYWGVNLVDAHHTPPTVQFHSMDHHGQCLPGGTEETPQTLFRIWRKREPVYRRDLDREDLYGERELLRKVFRHPIRAVVDVPFTQGTLAVSSCVPEAFSDEDLTFLQELAGVLEEGVTRRDDLRALAESEVRFFQAQKLEALGQLAGGVAHDFNNLLTVITGYCQLIRGKLEGEAQEDIEEILKVTEQGSMLLRQLLVFSRQQIFHPSVLELGEVVIGLERMLRRLLGDDIELLLALSVTPVRVLADEGQLGQVLVNLALNARDAMPTGGRLTIRTAQIELDATSRKVENMSPGPYALLAVHDTGMGMDPETRNRLFEPFFTTKRPGHGTGLGLSTVYGIVQQSHGAIQVESAPGQGSSFAIYLPRVDAPASRESLR